jgi:DNA modification methylase
VTTRDQASQEPRLAPDENNANRGTERGEAMLAESIRRYKIGRPILADKHGRIIAGNKTYQAAEAAGIRRVRYVHTQGDEMIVHVRDDLDLATDAAAMELGIADNRTSEVGLEWDPDMIHRLEEFGADVRPFWTDEEYAEAFGPPDWEGESEEDIGADPAVPIETESDADALARKWRTQRGQLWLIPGADSERVHRLYIGSATESRDTTALFGDDDTYADLLLTDPPYGVGYRGKTADALEIENDQEDDDALYGLIRDAMETAPLIPGGAFYICTPTMKEVTFRTAIEDAGLPIRQGLVWVKHHFTFGRFDYHWRHEGILYGWAPGAPHYFVADRTQDTIFLDDTTDYEAMTKPELIAALKEYARTEPASVWLEDRPSASPLHPTIKPARLFRKAIRNSTRPGERVYDPFLGSGTAIIASEQTGRLGYGMELSPTYSAVALERLSLLGLTPRLAGSDASER